MSYFPPRKGQPPGSQTALKAKVCPRHRRDWHSLPAHWQCRVAGPDCCLRPAVSASTGGSFVTAVSSPHRVFSTQGFLQFRVRNTAAIPRAWAFRQPSCVRNLPVHGVTGEYRRARTGRSTASLPSARTTGRSTTWWQPLSTATSSSSSGSSCKSASQYFWSAADPPYQMRPQKARTVSESICVTESEVRFRTLVRR